MAFDELPRQKAKSPSPPAPLRGANIGSADIITRTRERGSLLEFAHLHLPLRIEEGSGVKFVGLARGIRGYFIKRHQSPTRRRGAQIANSP